MEVLFPILMVLGLIVALPFIILARISSLGREVERLGERVRQLETRLAESPPVAPPGAPAVAPVHSILEATPAMPAPEAMPATAVPSEPPAPPATSAADFPAPAPPPAKPRDLEDLVGSVWLQNVGAVVVLLGVFFLILWGWTTGRFGPGVLVIAGVGLGFGVCWRGDRMRLRLPDIGHAIIGVGLGIVYLSLYLGHFTLRVLPAPFAFGALVATSALTAAAGLRYRVQGIAVLGILGAFLPTAIVALVPLHGFSMPAAGLLAYVASVNVLVFALAARAGWSGLALLAVGLTTLTWIATVPVEQWSWSLELGLAALFASLGLTPIPRLLRVEGTVRAQDLAVIAASPLALIACSWPMWSLAQPVHVAILLFSLAALQVGAALFVDARRPERDLWRPLVATAVIYLSAALERGLGTANSPLAWTLEGVVLTLLGLAPRAGWLRACGYAVTALGTLFMFVRMLGNAASLDATWPVWNADGIRHAVAIAALLFLSLRLRAARSRLVASESPMAGVWLVAANLAAMFWIFQQAVPLVTQLEGPGGRLRRLPDLAAAPSSVRRGALIAAITGVAWMVQASALVRGSLRSGWWVARITGYVVGVAAAIALLVQMSLPDAWGRDALPILHRDGLLTLAGIGLAALVGASLARQRKSAGLGERFAPEVCGALAALLALFWSAREADHVARAILDLPGSQVAAWSQIGAAQRRQIARLTPSLTSVAWLAQALGTLALGWWQRSAFLRWMALVLIGITTLKIVLFDLAQADPFWRFFAAIVTGVAMLGISYVYQRRRKSQAVREPAPR